MRQRGGLDGAVSQLRLQGPFLLGGRAQASIDRQSNAPKLLTQPSALAPSCRLRLTATTLANPLPEIQPGALPRLEELHIEFNELRSTLPASWGSSPDVLPSLQQLSLVAQVEGELPREWAGGFKRLANMAIVRMPDGATQILGEVFLQAAVAAQRDKAASTQVAEQGTRLQLPAEWATGFPTLTHLSLFNLGLAGTIPQAWQRGGFPTLAHL